MEIQAIGVLPTLFHEIFIPLAVLQELQLPHFPSSVRAWAASLPPWLKVETPSAPLPTSSSLHPGEAAAIALALQKRADRILLDDQKAIPVVEQLAAQQGLALQARGTLALLAIAAELRLINLPHAIHRLVHETRFRATPVLIQRFFNPDPLLRQLIAGEAARFRPPPDPHAPH
ncbi:MAG TPA: DUF3368 domain-containing protein [Phycisphaerae bacterium]|nr:DUF3368 domain-containing protein [Phycisphaerae bacterium]